MAINKGNSITNSYSGKFNNIVLQKNGFMRSLPDLSNRIWTPLQTSHLQEFEQAKAYGRFAAADPELSQHYLPLVEAWKKKTGKTNVGVYQVAISDFSHPPVIGDFKTGTAAGPTELQQLEGKVHDNFMVAGVTISIFLPSGKILEEKTLTEKNKGFFDIEYIPVQQNPLPPGCTALIRAWDIPGHCVEKLIEL